MNTQDVEPIAVVGMACRVPGAGCVEEFWRLLCEGKDAIREVPLERFDVDAVFSPSTGVAGRTTVRWGGFLDDVEGFDAGFFGIAPHEARLMDPAQRQVLEVGWEAVEDAGWAAQHLAGSDAGVFVGHNSSAYWELLASDPTRLDMYAANGSAAGVLSGRLSFVLDLRGPSLTVDTACSASLTAVHLACRSLQTGECSQAIVAGVHLVLSPLETIAYSQSGMLASDGWCKFGDRSADGFVRSDGVAAVALKPLRAAIVDGDRVRAVIRGSAMTNDGRSSGLLTAPSVEGQAGAIAAACAAARVRPACLDYVEAHGTGTPVGDPVELEALAKVVGPGRLAGSPCLVGSVKTNIGHAEGAAGLIGLVKTVLCLEHRAIPPSLHLYTPSVAPIREGGPLRIPTNLVTYPPDHKPLLAGVSSTGISGTNVHVVLAEAEERPSPGRPTVDAPRETLLPVSARTPRALRALARSYLHLLQEHRGQPGWWRDLCFSATTRRTHHPWRLAVQAQDPDDAAGELRAFLAGADPDTVHRTAAPPTQPWRIAFVFPGQGSQWAGMGLELLESEPVFRDQFGDCEKAIREESGWSLLEVLRDSPERLEEVDVVQPALWAIQVSLAALWRSWGITPDAVIGHSMGEVAAAHVAGALTLQDAAAVICRRSRIAKRLRGKGAMASVELPVSQAEEYLRGHEQQLAIAAYNSPSSSVISGDTTAMDQLLATLDHAGVSARRIRVDFASHCPQIDALHDELLDALATLAPRPGSIPLHSTVLDESVDGGGLNAEYWAANLRRPVRLTSALTAQLRQGPTIFIEISAHPVLLPAIRETITAQDHPGMALSSLRRASGHERTGLLSSLGTLYVQGHALDGAALHSAEARYTPLPPYPWQHKPYWFARDTATTPAAPTPTPDSHSAVDARLRGLAAEILGAQPDEIDPSTSLAAQGLDSLMAARLRHQIRQHLGVDLDITVMLTGAGLNDLATMVQREDTST